MRKYETRIDAIFEKIRADCSDLYSRKLQSILDTTVPYVEVADFEDSHTTIMDTSLKLVRFDNQFLEKLFSHFSFFFFSKL